MSEKGAKEERKEGKEKKAEERKRVKSAFSDRTADSSRKRRCVDRLSLLPPGTFNFRYLPAGGSVREGNKACEEKAGRNSNGWTDGRTDERIDGPSGWTAGGFAKGRV